MADDMKKTTGIEIPIEVTDNATPKLDRIQKALDNFKSTINTVNSLGSAFGEISAKISELSQKLEKLQGIREFLDKTKYGVSKGLKGRYTRKINSVEKEISSLETSKTNTQSQYNLEKGRLDILSQINDIVQTQTQYMRELLDLAITRVNASNNLKQNLLSEQDYVAETVRSKKIEAQLQKEVTETLAKDNKYIADRIAKEKASASINKQINAEVKEQKINYQTLAMRVSNFLGMVRRFTFVGYLVRSVTGLINDFAKAGADWTENLNLFEISFGSATKESIDNLIGFAEKLGVARNEIIKASADFQTLANSIGVSNDISAEFSIALTKLGYDIGSLRNLDFEDVFEKLQSTIYGGQVKTARTLGINITATGLEEMLAQLGLADVKFRQLSESQKVMLRAIATFKQLGTEGANVYGDLGNTITSLANRVRVFQANIQNLKLALSAYFEETFSTLVAKGTAFIQALTAILNVNIEQKLQSGFNNTADSIANANDEAEDFNKTLGLLNIDKFNVLDNGTTSGGTSNALDKILGQRLTDYIANFNKATDATKVFDKEVNDIKNNIIKFFYPLSEVNKETGEITIVTTKLNETIQGLINTFNTVKKTITIIFSTLLELAPTIAEIIGLIVSTVGNILLLLDKLELIPVILAAIATYKIINWGASLYATIDKLTTSFGNLITKLIAVEKPLIANQKNLKSTLDTANAGFYAFSILATGLTYFLTSLKDMSKGAKIAIPIIAALAATFTGLAVAKAGLTMRASLTAAAIAAGITLSVGTLLASVPQYKNGGVVEDGLFTMNKHEMFGKFSDGTSVVANNMQIIEGIKGGVYEAVKEAMGGNNGTQRQMAILNINGREFARATFNDYNYVGKTNTGFSWGGNKQ